MILLKIIKRDLSFADFDISKIENAIYKAFVSVGDEGQKKLAKDISNEVYNDILTEREIMWK